MNLKYMILGAGGTGGILGSALTKAGKDVTFIARGSNLDAMRNNGLIIRHLWDQTKNILRFVHYPWKNPVLFPWLRGYLYMRKRIFP